MRLHDKSSGSRRHSDFPLTLPTGQIQRAAEGTGTRKIQSIVVSLQSRAENREEWIEKRLSEKPKREKLALSSSVRSWTIVLNNRKCYKGAYLS